MQVTVGQSHAEILLFMVGDKMKGQAMQRVVDDSCVPAKPAFSLANPAGTSGPFTNTAISTPVKLVIAYRSKRSYSLALPTVTYMMCDTRYKVM